MPGGGPTSPGLCGVPGAYPDCKTALVAKDNRAGSPPPLAFDARARAGGVALAVRSRLRLIPLLKGVSRHALLGRPDMASARLRS